MRKIWGSTVMLGLATVLTACYPGDISNTGEADLVTTGARPGYPFAKKTYFMPDSVFYVQQEANAPDTFSHAFDGDILNAVEAGLAGYGYTRLPATGDPEAADLLVLNAVALNVNLRVWTWSPGYYPTYWGCCGGGYPWWPAGAVQPWRPGTVVTLMKDPSLEVEGDDGGNVWVGAMNGLAQGSDASSRSRIADGIAQAFAQSPYLSGGSSD